MRAAHAIVLLLLVTACSDNDGPCASSTCKTVEAKYRLGDRTIRDTGERTFVAEDGTYTLVRFEYGTTPECDDADENCSYSTYCAFVTGGVDYPLSATFVSDEDALFDLDDYCTDLGCDMPADDLAIFDDEAFEDWLWDADEDTDVLASCF
jgi:hypothetical protein